jgi:hypothetical protein
VGELERTANNAHGRAEPLHLITAVPDDDGRGRALQDTAGRRPDGVGCGRDVVTALRIRPQHDNVLPAAGNQRAGTAPIRHRLDHAEQRAALPLIRNSVEGGDHDRVRTAEVVTERHRT